MKKLAAIILSLSMIFSLTTNIGTTYAADTSASAVQITDSGGSDSKDGVTVSKTITGTDQENVFDITLTVETTQSLEELYEDPDMAIVIVMDISNSMTSTYGSTTRYDAAVSAASSFIDQFAEETMGISQLGFVAFNSDAYEVFGMRSCSSTSEATDLKNTMSTYTQNIINRYSDSDYYKSNRFTNIEAGLKMASDMLAEATNENKYIIFLSDGFPTTYIETGYEGYDTYTSSGTPGTDGVFFDYATGYYCSYGTSYSDKAAIRARQMATSIKESGTEIFSIGIDVGGQTIDGYERYGVSYSVIDRTSYSYEIGSPSSAAAFKNWLKGTTTTGIGSGYYYDTTDADALASAFTSIFTTIKEEITAGSTAQWVASDPLPTFSSGSDTTVEFIGFYDLSKNLTTSLTGSNVKNGENTASYSSNSISWDLKNSGYTTSTSTSGSTTTTTYTYSLTYRVRLQNESSSFAEDTSYATNGDASLSYIVTDSSGNETSGTIDFPVPEVKGYLGELTFTKVDQNGDAVKGAVFTLSHDTSTCDECRGDGSTSVTISDMTATSDENGTVSFTNIPSGHTYTLTETSVPDGYVANNSTYSVVVAYGVVTVTEKTNGTSTTWSSSDDYTIVNYELDTPEKDVLDNTGTSINGDMVKVGETLTYTIDYTNNTESEEKVVVTDKAPEGTSYVANSAKAYIDGKEITDPNIDVSADGTITWTVDSLASGSTLKVSFDVVVEDTAQSLDKNTVVNDALVTVDNDYELTTNTVTNDVPEDPVKDVVDDNGDSIDTDMVKVGDTLTYTIDYKNDTKDAESVVVTDKAPEGTSYVDGSAKAYIDGNELDDSEVKITVADDGTITWEVYTLEAGSTLEVRFNVVVEESALDLPENTFENDAQVIADNVYDLTTNIVTNNVPEKDVVDDDGNSIDGDLVGVGDTLTYTIDYKNTEDKEATVTITDKLDENVTFVEASDGGTYDGDSHTVTWTIENVASGETGSVSFKVAVNEKAAGTTVDNRALVEVGNSSAYTNTVSNDVPDKDVIDSDGNSIDGDLVSVGDTLTYTIDYKNTEDDIATVTITDELDSDVTFVSADNGGTYDADSHTVTWTIENVASGDSGTVSFKVTVNDSAAGTTVDNQALVEVGNRSAYTNTVTNTVPEKTVTIDNVDVNGDLVGVGQELTYTISYKNTEDGYATVFITDELDENVTFVSAENGGMYNSSTHTVVWVLSNLASGTEGTVSFKVTVNEEAAGDIVDNQALVQVGNSSAYTNKVTNTVPEKTVTINNVDVNGDTVNVGDTLTYSIYYKNTESEATTIVITDTLDSKVTYVSGSASDNGVYDKSTRTITWTLENVLAGESGYVTFNVTVNEEAEGQTVENTAYVQVGNNAAVQTNTVTNNVPEADTPTTTSEPKTGDNTHIALYAVCGLAALGLIAIFRKKREED